MAFARFSVLCIVVPLAAGLHRYGDEPWDSGPVGSVATASVRAAGKYVFVAGLEGSGHHFFQLVFEECLALGRCGNRSREFYRWAWGASKNHDPVSMRRVWQLEDPRPDAEKTDFTPQEDVVYPLNAVAIAGQMMSYPNYLPGNDPDIFEFYKGATALGDSMKVVVLVRQPRDLLHSVTRRFNHTEDDLVASLKVLFAQLKKMPKDAYKCLRYERFGDVGPSLQQYLGIPNFNLTDTMHTLYKEEPGCEEDGGVCPQAEKLKAEHVKFMQEICATAPSASSAVNFLRIDSMGGTELEVHDEDMETVKWLSQ